MEPYDTLHRAILARQSLSAVYEGVPRKFSPHALGRDNGGELNVMTFQYQGRSGDAPNWRCFHVAGLHDVKPNGEGWHTGSDHSRPNTCVTRIGVSV